MRILAFITCFLVIGISFFSCEKNRNENIKPIITSTELAPFLETFREEAALRGVEVPEDFNGITFEIYSFPGGSAVGVCYWNEGVPHHLTLDRDYWDSVDMYEKEYVLFHELGHCFLLRQHLNGSLGNGLCTSLMSPGGASCEVDYQNNRDYYLDELFGI